MPKKTIYSRTSHSKCFKLETANPRWRNKKYNEDRRKKRYQFTAARVSCQIPYTNVTILVTRYQFGLQRQGYTIIKFCLTINAV